MRRESMRRRRRRRRRRRLSLLVIIEGDPLNTQHAQHRPVQATEEVFTREKSRRIRTTRNTRNIDPVKPKRRRRMLSLFVVQRGGGGVYPQVNLVKGKWRRRRRSA